MRYGWGGHRVETRELRADRAALRAITTRARLARLTDEDRIALLAHAIADSIADRGLVAQADLCRTGLSDFDIERLYPAAIAEARALEPSLFERAFD
jgi:hypothetical protein